MSENINGHRQGGELSTDDAYEEVKIPVPWGVISGKWWGPKTKQPILALHGWQDNAGTFDTLAPLLAKQGLAILAIDLPGHGFSSHLPKGVGYYLFWDGVSYVRRLVKFFQWKDIVLMGHSLGGGISFLYAAVFPDEIKGFIQFDIAGPASYSLKRLKKTQPAAIDNFLRYETLNKSLQPRYNYEEMLQIVEDGYKGALTRDSCKIMMKRGMKSDTEKEGCYYFTRDVRVKVAALGLFGSDEVLQYARRIKCRVLNIRGNPGYAFEEPEFYDKTLDVLAENASQVVRHIVEGTHHLHLNTPELVAPLILKFMNELYI